MYAFCTNCNHVFINTTESEAPECPRCHEKTKYNNIIVKLYPIPELWRRIATRIIPGDRLKVSLKKKAYQKVYHDITVDFRINCFWSATGVELVTNPLHCIADIEI